MRYLLREFFSMLATICTIFVTGYMFVNEDWQCKAWAFLGAVLAVWISWTISKKIFKKKNKEIKDLSARKEELEIVVLGKKRLTSGYEPNQHV